MNFIKGVIVGTAIATVAGIVYADGFMNKKKIMKKGRELAKTVGIM